MARSNQTPPPAPVRIRAAGGLIVRNGTEGPEIALVHRPGRSDWSFPKGKAEQGEPDEACALREVLEETGLECKIECYFDESRYLDHRGRTKRVVYYLMRIQGGAFVPNAEVDEMRFVAVGSAPELLTYERDREIAAALAKSGLINHS